MEKIYLLVRLNNYIIRIPSVRIYFSSCGWAAISLDKNDYQVITKFGIYYYEITQKDAVGFKHFGDGRSIVSISAQDLEEDTYVSGNFDKIKIEVTQDRYDCIVNSMKLFAKVILEDEFDKKYHKLRNNSSALETQTWKIQLEEVEKFNSEEETPLLSSLAEAKGISVKELVDLINQKSQENQSDVKNLFIELVKLKTEFDNCNSIDDLNVLYAKYFGLVFQILSEYKESRPDIFDKNGEFLFQVPLINNF
jgi:hypothetical protein